MYDMGCKKLLIILIALALLFSYSYADSNSEESAITKLYLVTLEEGADQSLVADYGTIIHNFNIINGVAVELTDEALAQLSQEPAVLLIEENQTFTLEETQPEPPLIQKSLGGDLVIMGGDSASQWNLGGNGINAEAAWNNFPADGSNVKIAIIDTGINYNHELLDGTKYLEGKDFCQYRDPYCVEDPANDPMDEYGHGTMMATVMLATGENDGLKGIAPQAQYYPIKVTNEAAVWDSTSMIAGVEWAIEQNVDIIFIGLRSYQVPSVEILLYTAFEKGILTVGPNFETYEYPGRYPDAIGVGAHDNSVPQLVMSTTGNSTEVVAPGKDIPVIGKSGSDWIETVDNDPDVAAAQVAGALALMADYNRQLDLGYDNQALWDVLNYSAVDWVDPLAGNGKADVNAALYWMDQNWFIGKAVNYLNPNEPGDPPVYYYENAFDYEVEVTNNSDETFYNLIVKAKAVYLEGTRQGQDVAEIPAFETTIPQLDPSQSVVVGPSLTILATTIEPGLKGVLVEIEVGEQGVSGSQIMGFTEMSNGWILTTSPQEGVLHLTGMPVYNIGDYNAGAAAAKMILDFIRQAAGQSTLTQQEIYEYGQPYNSDASLTELDARGMDAVLGHFDPYDALVSDQYDYFDGRYDGNPYQGYNYTVQIYDDFTTYVREIAHWMTWPVPESTWWVEPQIPVAAPQTPAAVPIGGGYHWVAINGYAASGDPVPDPYGDPWYVPEITVYGFWLTDPEIGGIGQHVYVMAADAEAIYFKPMQTGDKYQDKYLQVAEPPAMPPEGEFEVPMMKSGDAIIAQPKPDLGNLEFVGVEVQTKDQKRKPRTLTGMT